MMSDEGPAKRSPGRRIFIGATWVALVYSVYSIAAMPDWRAWLPALDDDSRGVSSIPLPARPGAQAARRDHAEERDEPEGRSGEQSFAAREQARGGHPGA